MPRRVSTPATSRRYTRRISRGSRARNTTGNLYAGKRVRRVLVTSEYAPNRLQHAKI